MNVSNFSILEAVELAIGIEEEGERFYALAAAKTEEPEMKKLFETLREKESDRTFVYLERFLDPEVAAYFHGYIESAVFPVKGSAIEILAQCEGPADILRLGMQAEKDSILYYHELMAHSPYPDAADLLKEIIAEEHRHFAILRRELRKIEGA